MKKISLTGGQFALVDDADYEALSKSKYKWGAYKRGNVYYALRTVPKGSG
jgi:hypothetical protein